MEIKKNQILIVIFGLIFGVLFFRLIQLQIVEGQKYRKIAAENAAKTVPAPAPRGVIYDRSGKVMVENRPIFSIEEIKRNALTGMPVVVKDHVDLETVMRVEEKKRELEGVVVSVRPVRFYPYGNAASHLLGYIGEIEAEELKRLRNEGYRLGDTIGKDGVEKYYDQEIRGRDGGKKIEVDVYGKPTRLLESFDPVPGADVKLTIDLELQLAAEEALGEREGAVVIMNPKTGEILALASHPNYDPNSVWEALTRRRHPFMNRALALYPPGSIFKVVTLTAALEEKLAKPEEVFYCPGFFQISHRIAKCWKESGHGRISVAEGLVQSCDVVFYELGRRVGPNRLAKYAARYGLGEKTGIDLPQEKRGLVPTEEWKKKALKEPWYEGDSINYGIGQGFVQVTPLQMAAIYGTIAFGKRMKPYVVAEIKKRDGGIVYRGESKELGVVPLSKENLEVMRKALGEVVERGTGVAAKIEGIPAAGKTGTAENPGLPHAWFLCYAPRDDPQIVIASFVAHGEHGDRIAAYIAHDILAWYNENRLWKE